jgi:hypothetical protein
MGPVDLASVVAFFSEMTQFLLFFGGLLMAFAHYLGTTIFVTDLMPRRPGLRRRSQCLMCKKFYNQRFSGNKHFKEVHFQKAFRLYKIFAVAGMCFLMITGAANFFELL